MEVRKGILYKGAALIGNKYQRISSVLSVLSASVMPVKAVLKELYGKASARLCGARPS